MAQWRFELVAGPYGSTTEGPAWDGRHLHFSWINGGVILRYDPRSGEVSEWKKVPKRTNGLMFDAQGRLTMCSVHGRAIHRLEADGETSVVVDRFEGKRLNTPNDLTIARDGRIWFSNPWDNGIAPKGETRDIADSSILCATPQPDGTYAVTRLTFDTTKPNGVLLSADERTLYVSQQSYEPDGVRELRAYPIKSDGTLDKHIVLHQFGNDHRGMHRAVDGMCLDAEGNIVACAGWESSGPGPLIHVFTPGGRLLETHPLPSSAPSNCTFGDADLSTLYVTTRNGHLYRVRTDRQGWNLYP